MITSLWMSLGHVMNDVVMLIVDDIEKARLLVRVVQDVIELLLLASTNSTFAVISLILLLMDQDVMKSLLVRVVLDRLRMLSIAEDIPSVLIDKALLDHWLLLRWRNQITDNIAGILLNEALFNRRERSGMSVLFVMHNITQLLHFSIPGVVVVHEIFERLNIAI